MEFKLYLNAAIIFVLKYPKTSTNKTPQGDVGDVLLVL